MNLYICTLVLVLCISEIKTDSNFEIDSEFQEDLDLDRANFVRPSNKLTQSKKGCPCWFDLEGNFDFKLHL